MKLVYSTDHSQSWKGLTCVPIWDVCRYYSSQHTTPKCEGRTTTDAVNGDTID